jgi:branched-chain amino acid transport system substrate-binding protein
MRRWGLFAFIAVHVVGMGAAARSEELPNLNVGLVLPLTGTQAPFGRELDRGIALALELATDPTAKKVHLVRIDDASQTKGLKELVEKRQTDDRLHVLIGGVSGLQADVLVDVAAKSGKPYISPIVPVLPKQPNVFSISIGQSAQGNILGVYAATTLTARSAAVLSDGMPVNAPLIDGFKAALGKHGSKVVGEYTYELGATNYKTVLKEIKAKSPSVVLLPAYAATAAQIMTQAKEVGLKAKFLGTDAWDTVRLSQSVGAAGSGHMYISHYAPDRSEPAVQEFKAAYRNKFKREPGAIAALGYDAMRLVLSGFATAKSNAKDVLVKSIQQQHGLTGATGTIGFRATGELDRSALIMELGRSQVKFKTEVSASGETPNKG